MIIVKNNFSININAKTFLETTKYHLINMKFDYSILIVLSK